MKEELKARQRRLLDAVGVGLQKHGFEPRIKDQSYCRSTPLGRAVLHLAFINHENDFDATADVAVRFDEVERLQNADKPYLSKSEKAATCTLGCELGTLTIGQQQRWTVASESDVPAVARDILEALEKVGIPYVDRFSDPAQALEVLSGDNPDSWLHCPFHDARAMSAVSLALQVHGREAAIELAKTKAKFLEERNDEGLSAFRAFVKRIGVG